MKNKPIEKLKSKLRLKGDLKPGDMISRMNRMKVDQLENAHKIMASKGSKKPVRKLTLAEKMAI